MFTSKHSLDTRERLRSAADSAKESGVLMQLLKIDSIASSPTSNDPGTSSLVRGTSSSGNWLSQAKRGGNGLSPLAPLK